MAKYCRLRPLVKIDQMESSLALSKPHRFSKFFVGLCAIVLAIFLANYCTANSSGKHFVYLHSILRNITRNYRNQYKEIVYGRVDYCNRYQLMNVTGIFNKIRELNVLHQKAAVQQLEKSLLNDTDFNAIALVGGVGVGKSLVVRAICENFPWPDNVHNYAWNTHVNHDYEKFHLLRVITDQLSDCGYNLMVIENLRVSDYNLVNVLNKRIAESVYTVKRVIVIYVFSLNMMTTTNDLLKQRKLLYENLPNTTIITFDIFNKNELKDCILREAFLENVTLSAEDFDEITETINPLYSGCKNVNAKVLLYGTIKSKTSK